MKRHEVVAQRFVLRNLYQKPNGQWACRIRDIETGKVRERCARAPGRAAALGEIRQWLEAVAAAEGGGLVGIPLLRGLREYIGTRDIRPDTQRFYQKQLLRLEEAFGDKLTTSLRLAEVEEYVQRLRQKGNSPRTIGMQISLLRSFYRWARRRGYAERDPTEGIELGGYRPSGRALTPEEARRLLEATDHPQLRLWLLLGLYTGIRSRNLHTICWRHIDLAGGKIHFAPEEMKNGRPFSVPIHPVLGDVLRAEADRRRVLRLDEALIGPFDIRKAWFAAERASGVGHVRPHDLRHTFGTWIAMRAPYAVQQALLGHSPQEITLRYTHCPWSALEKAIRRLPNLIAQQTGESSEKISC